MKKRIDEIRALLEASEGVGDYRINTTRTESQELFFVHRALETIRSTDTADIKVTVLVEHDGKLGDATFSVYASYDNARIAAEIESAVKKAALIDNEKYSLPEGEKMCVESDSNFAKYDTAALAAELVEAVYSADSYEDGSINALEIFIYRDTVNVTNSRGIDKTETRYRAMIEAIPTWGKGEQSVELYECYNFTEFDRETVRAEIDGKMREVRDRLAAKPPMSKLDCPVLLGAPEFAQLVSELAFELNFSRVYNRSNAFSVGDEIQKAPRGDKLTVTMCGKMKGSVRSASFDSDGATLCDTKVIDGGVACDYFGATRYASYLGKKPTGNLGCVSVECGTLSENELASQPYFECVSMSGLQLDIYNDYIGGEVRLAYYFDGEKKIPITGISISGKLSEALASLRLADSERVYEAYRGPKYALLCGVEIV